MDNQQSNYLKYRGKCYEYSVKAIEQDPTLTLVRGHYWCPIWNTEEPHWWTVRADGTIHDPTKLQFPSGGGGEYIPFDGNVECANCNKKFQEGDVGSRYEGRYAFCSTVCNMRFVGL